MTDLPPPGGSLGGPPPPAGPAVGPAPGWWQASDGNWYPPDEQPGYGAPPPFGGPAYGYGYTYGVQPASGTNGLAIASLVCSLLTFVTCITGILGVIFGHVALAQIKRNGQQGRGLAIAGLIVGYVSFVVIIGLVILLIAAGNETSDFNQVGNDVGWALR